MEQKKIPKTLDHVLSVAEITIYEGYININRKRFEKIPMEIVRDREDLSPKSNTIPSECQRSIGLTAAEFRNMLKEKEALISHLVNWFPDHEEIIISRLRR